MPNLINPINAQTFLTAQHDYERAVAEMVRLLTEKYVGKTFRKSYGGTYPENFLVTFTSVKVEYFSSKLTPTFVVNGLKHRKDRSVGLNRDFFFAAITADGYGDSEGQTTYTPEEA